MYKIEKAVLEDMEWVGKLFSANKKILGEMAPTSVFYRWFHGKNPREKFVVIRPFAFAHYLVRLDGIQTLYEIAVQEDQKRKGMGSSLLEFMGRPISLKTDATNDESNLFYRKLGFHCVSQITGGSGKKLNIYQMG